jgi:hypothetical protein
VEKKHIYDATSIRISSTTKIIRFFMRQSVSWTLKYVP